MDASKIFAVAAGLLATACAAQMLQQKKVSAARETRTLTCRRVRENPDRAVLARELAEEAANHFLAGQYLDAAGDYLEAYDMTHSAAFLFNAAQSYAKLSFFGIACIYMHSFVEVAKDPEDKAQGESRLHQLEQLHESWKQMHPGAVIPYTAWEWSHMKHDDTYPNGHKHGLTVCK